MSPFQDDQSEHGAVVGDTLRRLLRDLAKEVTRLSSDHATLQQEYQDLRSKLHSNEPSPLFVSLETSRRPSPQSSRGVSPVPGPRMRSLRSPRASSVGSSPRMLEPRGDAAVPDPMDNELGSVIGGAESLDFDAHSVGSEEDPMNVQPSKEQIKALEEQFERICKKKTHGPKMLTVWDCHKLVSQHEHKVYGHNKHHMHIVRESIKLIAKEFNQQIDGCASMTGNGSRAGNAQVSPRDNEVAMLDKETFVAFMTSNHHISKAEGGDIEYLQKAIQADENEHQAEQYREKIAKKNTEAVDPRPTGCRQIILEHLPPPIIFFNAIVLGIQADIQSPVWEVLEQFFLAFYILELTLKFQLLGCWRFFRGVDAWWNVFDLLMVVLSLVDLGFRLVRLVVGSDSLPTVFLNVLKFLRMARLGRVIKSFRSEYFSDLKGMLAGVLSGAKVLTWAVIIFFMGVFVLGVVMREIIGEKESEFRNVPSSMFSVFRCFTDGCVAYNGTPLHERLRDSYGGVFMVPYILLFLIVNFGVFNLIVAVFIDRVLDTTVKSKQEELGQRENEMKVSIEEMLVNLVDEQKGGDKKKRTRMSKKRSKQPAQTDLIERAREASLGMARVRAEKINISRELFNAWLENRDVLHLLEDVNIDTALKSEIFDVCDVDKSGSLTCDELVSGLMRLRGPISKCDVIAIRLKVRYLTKMLEDIHGTLHA